MVQSEQGDRFGLDISMKECKRHYGFFRDVHVSTCEPVDEEATTKAKKIFVGIKDSNYALFL